MKSIGCDAVLKALDPQHFANRIRMDKLENILFLTQTETEATLRKEKEDYEE